MPTRRSASAGAVTARLSRHKTTPGGAVVAKTCDVCMSAVLDDSYKESPIWKHWEQPKNNASLSPPPPPLLNNYFKGRFTLYFETLINFIRARVTCHRNNISANNDRYGSTIINSPFCMSAELQPSAYGVRPAAVSPPRCSGTVSAAGRRHGEATPDAVQMPPPPSAPVQGWNSQFCFWSQRIYNGGRICYISYVFMVPY